MWGFFLLLSSPKASSMLKLPLLLWFLLLVFIDYITILIAVDLCVNFLFVLITF